MLDVHDDLNSNVQLVLEDEPLLRKEEEETHDKDVTPDKTDKADKVAMVSTRPTKVLFLDGIRGLAAILVVMRHAQEYMHDVDVGAVAVDTFFVLSSFLLTWLFMKRSIRLVNQRAGVRTWLFALADYFAKRFFRVYPLFAMTCIVLWFMDDEARKRYYFVEPQVPYDLYKTLTFEFDYRYFVFWTLPLEISYYFFIPVFVAGTLCLRKVWWVPYLPAYGWVITEGINTYRAHHMELRPHFSTFLAGSMAAVIFVKIDMWVKSSGFQFRFIHKLILRTIEFSALAVFLSLTFNGLLFVWVHENPVPKARGHFFVSVHLTIVLVCEMLLPSPLSSMLEWNVLRYCGKISFSVYLLHGFVLYNEHVKKQPNYYCRFFSRFGLICMLATASYHLIEYPSQLVTQRITKALKEQEIKGSGGLTVFLGEWANPWKMLADRLGSCAAGKVTCKCLKTLTPAKKRPNGSVV